MNFFEKVYKVVAKIPRGKVVTYKELARVCGTSPRTIGRIMARNENPFTFPCYKVVSSTGELRGYSAWGGVPRKRDLLKRDGITFDIRGRVEKQYFYSFAK